MKVEIEVMNGLGEFLKAMGIFLKVDPDTFLREYVEMYANESVISSLDTLGDNTLFTIRDIERVYGLEIWSKLSESDVKRLKKEFVTGRSL